LLYHFGLYTPESKERMVQGTAEKRLVGRVALLGGVLIFSHHSLVGAEIAGQVTAGRGRPVAYANVVANPRVVSGPGAQRFGAVTDENGRYRITDVDPGSYSVCVFAPGRDLLNPCQWSAEPPVAEVTPSRNVNLDIELEAGRRIQVRIEDPERLLRTAFREAQGASIVAGVWTREGFFHPLGLASSDDEGHNYAIVAPFDRELKLSLEAANARVVTENGAPVDRSQRAPVTARREAAAPVLRYRVTAAAEGRR
jgi:hypothetical protein